MNRHWNRAKRNHCLRELRRISFEAQVPRLRALDAARDTRAPRMYFGRDGKPITFVDAIRLIEFEDNAVLKTKLPNRMWVSTIHLILDHGYGSDRPIIFETMVFPRRKVLLELDTQRYSTLEEAKAGHAEMVAKWKDKPPAEHPIPRNQRDRQRNLRRMVNELPGLKKRMAAKNG